MFYDASLGCWPGHASALLLSLLLLQMLQMSLENPVRPCAALRAKHYLALDLGKFAALQNHLGLWNQLTRKNLQRAHKLSCINGFCNRVQKQLITPFSDQINLVSHREVVISGGNSCNSCWTDCWFVNIHTHYSLYVHATAWITCAVAHAWAHLC